MSPAGRPRLHLPAGLLARLLVILLLTLGVEFAASTLLYERSSRALVRDDEAHRLAEHLAVAAKLVAERPPAERAAFAGLLSTGRYRIAWHAGPPFAGAPSAAPALLAMKRRVVAWEPSLDAAALRLRMVTARRRPMLAGALRLADGSTMAFLALPPGHEEALSVQRVAVALLPAALLLVLGGWAFRRTLGPMAMLAQAADRIGRGGGAVLPERGPEEVRRLIRAFNGMQARIHQLIGERTEALAAVGHDLRTPLARLQLRGEAVADPALRREIGGDVAEMEAMVGSLLAYLGGEADPEAPVLSDVAVLLATIADDAADRGGDVRYVGPDHLEARVRPVGLKRAVANLVDNAVHYGDRAVLSLDVHDADLAIAVEDEGPGIPPDRLADVLQPFARLDPARGRNTRGLGLGLAIVARAIELEGGTLTLANRAGGGLRAALSLPRR